MSDREEIWADLMRRANRGDGAAYARLLSELVPVIRRIVTSRGTRAASDAEDVVQDVLLAVHAKRHTWRETDPLAPWIYAIARYKTADAARRFGGRISVPIDDMADDLPGTEGPDAAASGDVTRLLAGLDGRSAMIVRAVGVEERSAAEVGAEHGMTEGAVRVAYHRAIVRLRQMVGADDGST
jgi:RNA polymerase sigma-70 factor (ECF subfamily)